MLRFHVNKGSVLLLSALTVISLLVLLCSNNPEGPSDVDKVWDCVIASGTSPDYS